MLFHSPATRFARHLRTAAWGALTLLALSLSLNATAGVIGPKPRAQPRPAEPAREGSVYGERADLMRFAAELAQAQGLDRERVLASLSQARMLPAVKRLIMPPATGTLKNWAAYRDRFVEPRRIGEGVQWWRAQEDWLRQAEQKFGVPAEIVVAIVGVETFYGRVTGGFRVIDALATLSFDFPSGRSDRSAYFREELANFFVLCDRENIDPLAVKGSFAGAMGLPQFMPGSELKYAVDFDADGRVDLDRSAADVIGSVANFLVSHGWQRDMPTHFSVTPPGPGESLSTLLAPDILPSFPATDFERLGARLDDPGRAHEGPLALVELHNGGAAPSYVAGTQNFYTITRYNWSSYYALAVIELARTMRAVHDAGRPSPTAIVPENSE